MIIDYSGFRLNEKEEDKMKSSRVFRTLAAILVVAAMAVAAVLLTRHGVHVSTTRIGQITW
jgi:ABC-type enterochelin transport system permease subunit